MSSSNLHIISRTSSFFEIVSKCGFTSNLCTWRSITTSMQIEFVRWVVFIQCLARCYISVLITVSHVIALATLSVSTLESLWKVENHRFLINPLKFLFYSSIWAFLLFSLVVACSTHSIVFKLIWLMSIIVLRTVDDLILIMLSIELLMSWIQIISVISLRS